MSIRRLFNNSFFSIVSKFTNALIQLISLPILIKVFGKGEYGLIVIAMSLNTFIAIIQIGLPTGLTKFVAEWLAEGNRKQLNSAIQTISIFYLAIAFINFIAISIIALYGTNLFNVNADQIKTLQTLLIITAITSLLAIPATALNQLLIGAQELGFVSRLDIMKNICFAGLVALVYFEPNLLSVTIFYALQCTLMFMLIPVKIWRWSHYGSLKMFLPGWHFKEVLPLLKYSLSLVAFSIFIAMADRLRPIILGIRVPNNTGEALTEYQIINYIRILLHMISSSFMGALIPHISGAVMSGNRQIYTVTITEGTKYTWVVGALLGFGIIMLSKEVLTIYVGPENLSLNMWLIILVGASLYNFYVTNIASVILSSGKLMPMLFATATGFVISVLICWFMTPLYGVGAVVISVAAYNVINMVITHFWYLPRYFNVNAVHQILHIMLPPVFAGIIMCFAGRLIINKIGYSNAYINVAIGAICGTVIYISIILISYIHPKEIFKLYSRIITRK